MGGFGSGRCGGSGRDTVESCRSIDVNWLHRKRYLVPGCYRGLEWTCDGKSIASIGVRAEAGSLHLIYRWRSGGGEWENVTERVPIVRVRCPLGGSRPYFICPGVVNGCACGRRVAKLHGPGRYFLCRHCYRLAHASQNETQLDRELRRSNKIKLRLGGTPGLYSFPNKPKGMWSRTYERLRDEAFDIDCHVVEFMDARCEEVMARIDSRKQRSERRRHSKPN